MASVSGNSLRAELQQGYMGEYERLTGSWKDGAPVYQNTDREGFLYYCGELRVQFEAIKIIFYDLIGDSWCISADVGGHKSSYVLNSGKSPQTFIPTTDWSAPEWPETVTITSSGGAREHKASRLGVYLITQDGRGGAPVYRQAGGTEFLFYSELLCLLGFITYSLHLQAQLTAGWWGLI